ncbi:hypothetical protein [Salinimicrobium sp. GXAS 041]|uniref:hypothetical protein n=1 Tax=Salinimicrobium sp. GXAS 041 TaxID=3400806 RepID=UPI003C72C4BA
MAARKITYQFDSGSEIESGLVVNDVFTSLSIGTHSVTARIYDENNNVISSSVRNFQKVAGYEQETTQFSIDSGVTDALELSALDQTIKYYKAQNVWGIITAFQPMVGSNATQRGFNAKDTSAFNLTFAGGWVFDASGNKGNGTNTYATCGFTPSAHWPGNVGFSIAQLTKGSGGYLAGSELTYASANQPVGKARWMRGGYNEAHEVSNPSGVGIITGINISDVHELLIDQVTKFTSNVNIVKPSTEWHYGTTKYNGNLLTPVNSGYIGSQVLFSPTSKAQAVIIAEGQRQLEVALGRM